ncbi:MAG: nucleoside recognition domain-containing protein [Bacillota bacterium]|uniref:nucleoside recognition domain-containing protein n=1 Tax=Desulforudis sp. DRI-14 TaxID=3459793 RepID=UPI003473FAE0
MHWVWDTAWRAVEVWARALPYTVLGVLLANLALGLGFFQRLHPLFTPLLRRIGFTSDAGIALLVAFGSPPTAVAMLAGLYQEGRISRRETLLTAIGTWFPQTVYESVVYLAPVAIPFLGSVGLAYTAFFLANGLLVSGVAFIAAAFLLRPGSADSAPVPATNRERPLRDVFGHCIKRTVYVLRRMVLLALPVSIAAMLLVNAGWFKEMLGSLDNVPLPPAALTAIPVCLANPVAAYAMLGDLLQQGVLNPHLTLLTLMLANFVTSLRYILAHRLPYYVGLFGSRLGLEITAVGALLRLGWTGVFIVLLFIW